MIRWIRDTLRAQWRLRRVIDAVELLDKAKPDVERSIWPPGSLPGQRELGKVDGIDLAVRLIRDALR